MQGWDGITPLQAALMYAADGFPVCPVISPAYTLFGKKTGKQPFIGYFRRATTDPRTLKTWFERHPLANVGILISPVDCFAIDVDIGRDGFLSLGGLPSLPATRENITGSGGRHLLFRDPAAARLRSSKDLLGPGLDFIAAGLPLVVPPSVSYTGLQYRWADFQTPIAEAPPALLRLIDEASAARGALASRLADAFRPPRWDPIRTIKYSLCSLAREIDARIGRER